MPRAKSKKAASKGGRGKSGAKGRTAAKPAAPRRRRRLTVTLSTSTVRANDALARILGQLRAERTRLREAQTTAARVAGKGRGARPKDPRAAKNAKTTMASSRAKIVELRARRSEAMQRALRLRAQDRVAAKVQAIRAQLEADNAVGFAKIEKKLDRSIRAFSQLRRAELVKMEERRVKARQRRAERAVLVAERQGMGRRRRRRKAAA